MIVFNTSGDGLHALDGHIADQLGGLFVCIDRAGQRRLLQSPSRAVRAQQLRTRTFLRRGSALGTTPQQFSYNLNVNGTGTEFSILAAEGRSSTCRLALAGAFAERALRRTSGRSTRSHAGASASGVWRFDGLDGRRRPDRSAVRLAEACMLAALRQHVLRYLHQNIQRSRRHRSSASRSRTTRQNRLLGSSTRIVAAMHESPSNALTRSATAR